MFTSKELEGIPIPLSSNVYQLEERIMSDLVMRIKASKEISSTADWDINRLKTLGKSKAAIKKELQLLLDYSDAEIGRLYSDVMAQAYVRDKALYKASGKEFVPFRKNKEMQKIIKAIKEQTKGEFKNITNTMGFVTKENGQLTFTQLSKYYESTLDGAVLDITTGTFDYNTVLKRIVHEMTSSGLRTVDYASGRTMRIESAMRNALMTGFNQTVSKMNDDIANKLETDLFEVDWHGGARPSHQKWQGRLQTRLQLVTVCGLGTPGGLLGCSCYHSYFAFVKGASIRAYTDAELDELNAAENKLTEYHGKEYTTYEATQRQRQMELSMRKQRQDVNLLQQGEADADDIIIARAKYRGTSAQYADFSTIMEIPQQKQRITVDGLGNLNRKTIVKPIESDIIPLSDINIHKSLGAAAFNYPVKMLDGRTSKLTEGTKITKVFVFSGKGTQKPIKVAEHLSKQYGVPPGEWEKVRGDGYVDDNGASKHVELHWFESEKTGKIKMKVKRKFDES